jgi:hypothetical protein
MSVLGTMMLRAGLLSESQVDAANEHAASRSMSHVDAILELGLADEDTLVAFLASKLMIPRVRSAVLERVGPQALERLPPLLAWSFKCVPISVDELGNLTVAMSDPTDPRAIAAIAEQTGAYLVRAVSSASDLRRALEHHYGPEHRVREQAAVRAPDLGAREAEKPTELALEPVTEPPRPQARPQAAPYMTAQPIAGPVAGPVAGLGMSAVGIPDDDDDDVPIHDAHGVAHEVQTSPPPQTDDDPHARPTVVETQPQAADPHERPTFVETTAPAPVPRGPRRPRAHTPWNPPLQGFNTDPVPLSPEAFAQVLPMLEGSVDRDSVTAVLLDFLGAGFNRVILFVHSHNELRGLDARGKDLLVEAVRQVRIPSGGKSMFSEVLERGSPYFGPMQSTSKIDQAFAQALGGLKGNVLLLPIAVGPKIPLLLWAHGTSHPVDPRSIAELSDAVSKAIHRILAARRR